MEIWQAGARMPFLVESYACKNTAAIVRYNWNKKNFGAYFLGTYIELNANMVSWNFVKHL